MDLGKYDAHLLCIYENWITGIRKGIFLSFNSFFQVFFKQVI